MSPLSSVRQRRHHLSQNETHTRTTGSTTAADAQAGRDAARRNGEGEERRGRGGSSVIHFLIKRYNSSGTPALRAP